MCAKRPPVNASTAFNMFISKPLCIAMARPSSKQIGARTGNGGRADCAAAFIDNEVAGTGSITSGAGSAR